MSEASVEGIGEQLRAAREHHHITLRGASRRLKIREAYLKALEDEDFAVLPQGAYVLGFLRNYALLLHLNYRELRDQYRKQFGGKIAEETEIAPEASTRKRIGFILTPARVIAFTIIVGSALFLWYLFSQYQSLTRPPILELSSPLEGEVFNARSIRITGRTDHNATLRINGEEVHLSTEGIFEREFVALKNGPESLEIVSENRISGKQTIIHRNFNVALPSSDAILPNGGNTTGTTAPVDTGITISIRTLDSVWFRVSVDDGANEDFLMEDGQTRTFHAKSKIYVRSGKAYAAYVSVNSKPEELMGTTSVVERTWTLSDL
ncbi:hypothetical protein AUK40_04795 [Candidatus Wirthbacteria bacterium CG2_30_54_11]|uniref:Cytoskeleton protein RodZ-like C-terminal domain-containing protein n=1 Tax=Candidatus Wirthbacteria bacterium CG2_30_54_11 TaxID=1817892 RepID=A0A1J5IHM1_9BACT|nr:MAG: hypothetical protein AUK40_04795 [Candidatus Wirthbacteria bacterium CG2_30_54_11]